MFEHKQHALWLFLPTQWDVSITTSNNNTVFVKSFTCVATCDRWCQKFTQDYMITRSNLRELHVRRSTLLLQQHLLVINSKCQASVVHTACSYFCVFPHPVQGVIELIIEKHNLLRVFFVMVHIQAVKLLFPLNCLKIMHNA